MGKSKKYGMHTRAIHTEKRVELPTGDVMPPIHLSTTYESSQPGEYEYFYGRSGNPTREHFERTMASLEGVENHEEMHSFAMASGMAAVTLIGELAKPGDHVVITKDVYGGTTDFFSTIATKRGVKVDFCDFYDVEKLESLLNEETKLVWIESPSNPRMNIFELKKYSEIVKKHSNAYLVADGTFSTPFITKPLEHGVDIVFHSTTKYIGGHGTAIAGSIVDSGNFDWTADPKRQPLFNEPDASYGGAVWGKVVPELTGANVAFAVRARVTLLRDIGAALSPDNAFGVIQGLETVALRMKQHCSNAEKVVEFLKNHEEVTKVIYPTEHDKNIADRAEKYLKGGKGALVGIELKGGLEAGKKFIDSLKLLYHVANIGDARSLAIHPASTTHSQLTPEEQLKAGVTPGYVRLSIGIEHVDDIIEDIEQALNKSSKGSLKAVS